jgi:hypothetical protein
VPVAEFHEAVSQQITGVATRQFAGLHQQLAANVAGVATRQLAGLHQQFAEVAGVTAAHRVIADHFASARLSETEPVVPDTVVHAGRCLAALWLQCARDLATHLRSRPQLRWASAAVVFFVLAEWFLSLRATQPQVADDTEAPFWALACLVLGVWLTPPRE